MSIIDKINRKIHNIKIFFGVKRKQVPVVKEKEVQQIELNTLSLQKLYTLRDEYAGTITEDSVIEVIEAKIGTSYYDENLFIEKIPKRFTGVSIYGKKQSPPINKLRKKYKKTYRKH